MKHLQSVDFGPISLVIMIKILFFMIFMSGLALADDGQKVLAGFDPKTDTIADNYETGPYLIYDCQEKHWTCVMEPYFKECQDKHQEDLKTTDEFHRCVPVGVLPTKKSCFQRQLFLTTHNQGQRFCIKDMWKEKNINY